MSILKSKKLYTITLLLALMLIITFMKGFFIDNIKKVAISNNNIEGFTKYSLREGRYTISLPKGWEVREESKDDDLIISFNNESIIYGDISIVDGELVEVSENIDQNNKHIKTENNIYIWKVITLDEDGNIDKYYLRNYSEGRVLIIKYSYKKSKVKNSIKVVFDNISDSFQ
ncbi:hypothetical protein [Clostridium tertium]|uniref:Uncharacterized protein n=2 Tax=Clostridium tertium TaxID=1559 RepID=A0A6N3FYX3_9CLOT